MKAAVIARVAGPPAGEGHDRDGGDNLLHAGVYSNLRRRLITGQIMPGVALSTRGLALELGVSQTPVREALSRLAAEGAVQIRSKRALVIPPMTPERFEDLFRCRLLLEPEAAALAMPHLDAAQVLRLRSWDEHINAALRAGDVNSYMEGNFNFHFGIYRVHGRTTLNQLIETLWLQFGPYMRVVYGRLGTANLVDQHQRAIAAIAAQDEGELRAAVREDIAEGMNLIGGEVLALGGLKAR